MSQIYYIKIMKQERLDSQNWKTISNQIKYRKDNYKPCGSYGILYQAYHNLIKKPIYMKHISRSLCLKYFPNYKEEIQQMYKIKHDNILALYGYDQTSDGGIVLYLQISHQQPLSSLFNTNIPDQMIKNYVTQLFDAMEFLNTKNLLHQKLRLENIKLSTNKKLLKIIDFNIAMEGFDANQFYNPPETIYKNEISKIEKQDVWVAGLIIYQMLGGVWMFRSPKEFQQEINQFANSNFKISFLKEKNPIWQRLLRNMLIWNPDMRPTFKEIRKFFQQQCQYQQNKKIQLAKSQRKSQRKSLQHRVQPKMQQKFLSPNKDIKFNKNSNLILKQQNRKIQPYPQYTVNKKIQDMELVTQGFYINYKNRLVSNINDTFEGFWMTKNKKIMITVIRVPQQINSFLQNQITQLDHPNLSKIFGIHKKMKNVGKITEKVVNQSPVNKISKREKKIIYEKQLQSQIDQLFIFSEDVMCEKQQTLSQLISKYKGERKIFSEQQLLSFVSQIFDVMAYLNNKRKMHGKLSPLNIFIVVHNDKEIIIKISSLDIISCNKNNNIEIQIQGPFYHSPQVANEDKCVIQSDVWSVGQIMLQMITGIYIYQRTYKIWGILNQLNNMKVYLPPYLNKIPQKFHPIWSNLIKNMLIQNNQRRLKFHELKQQLQRYRHEVNQHLTSRIQSGNIKNTTISKDEKNNIHNEIQKYTQIIKRWFNFRYQKLQIQLALKQTFEQTKPPYFNNVYKNILLFLVTYSAFSQAQGILQQINYKCIKADSIQISSSIINQNQTKFSPILKYFKDQFLILSDSLNHYLQQIVMYELMNIHTPRKQQLDILHRYKYLVKSIQIAKQNRYYEPSIYKQILKQVTNNQAIFIKFAKNTNIDLQKAKVYAHLRLITQIDTILPNKYFLSENIFTYIENLKSIIKTNDKQIVYKFIIDNNMVE